MTHTSRRSHRWTILLGAALVVGLLAGCGGEDGDDGQGGEGTASLPDGLIVPHSPGDATPVATLKDNAQPGDEVIVQGRIGGSVSPFAEGFAIFTIVDRTEPMSCGPDHCKTPWDYCCTPPDRLKRAMATVQIADADGRPLERNVAGAEGLRPYRLVTVKGTIAEVVQGSRLVVNADAIHVESGGGGQAAPHAGHDHHHEDS